MLTEIGVALGMIGLVYVIGVIGLVIRAYNRVQDEVEKEELRDLEKDYDPLEEEEAILERLQYESKQQEENK